MSPRKLRAVGAVVAFNLALFVGVVSLPAFESAHHHWIFPVLAALLGVEWALSFVLRKADRLLDAAAARGSVVSALLFLLVMGIVRHATILACFDRCSFKLAAAAAIAAPVFVAHARLADPGFWNPLRASLAGLWATLGALYLGLRGLQAAPWSLNLGFTILALLCWLRRERPLYLITALGVFAGIAIRSTANEYAIIGLGLVCGVLLPLAFAGRAESWLERRAAEKARLEAKAARAKKSLRRRVLESAGRIAAAVAVLAALGVYAAGPIFFASNPGERQAVLVKLAPKSPVRDPKTLSPLAARLRAHVAHLALTIGERDAYQRKNRERARDYVAAQLKSSGYAPKRLDYGSLWLPSIKNGTLFSNIEAVLSVRLAGDRPAWILGAHYDSAPGTPGADDNASGVAVLLEAARLLKQRRPLRDIRFVGFGTEEPPSFGTRNMGSFQYARYIKDNGVKVHGMISLEMLGYFNPKKGSQLYPPFLHLFFPDHGDFIGIVGNIESRGLLSAFSSSWGKVSRFPLSASILPGPFSGLALSDQLNFWDQGYSALMLSDTAFYRNPHYHEAGDLPDTLDYERMAELTVALVDAVERQ